MSELFIFGGTTEGRELAEFCCGLGIKCGISVTTDYGAELLPDSELLDIHVAKTPAGEMQSMLSELGCSLVIDATHPYASEATANIRSACCLSGARYVRLLREAAPVEYGITADDIDELVGLLNRSEGVILSTLGSKELPALRAVKGYRQRVWVRVLPAEGIIELCTSLGFSEDKIIAERGPFSFEQNTEHIRRSGAEILVTKESGSAGGYSQKSEAARQCGVELITLRRPADSGISMSEAKALIEEMFGKRS